ncbi:MULTISPECIES: DEAD/DEAH box helicase [Methanobacterium]|uniref:DEAD/DEAH box helicase n=1 Tax=Methanobacterium veterum TaxID=408577 RepID=A0A9E4ZZL7_9EURY|nr:MULTISPECIES: DEAD/DEAH box helicase [Methanobacterium]MCZ3366394.1 DEAD/DEAH box helicase [Methanobacterium veterum]MCZ3371902.1 DEAD/DEAH box helicase [Methanobacterium veterum]
MDKEEYLLKKESELKDILDNNVELRNYISQTFAKKINTHFKEKFSEKYLWRYALYLSSKGATLLENNPESQVGIESLRIAAEIYENLYYVSKFYDKEYSLILSSLCYDISGYQANAKCLIDKLVNSKSYYSLYENESDILLKYENKVLKTIQLFLQKKINLLSKEIKHFELNNIDNFYSHYDEFFKNYINSINSLCEFILNGYDEEYLDEVIESYEDALHSGNVLLTHIVGLFKTRLMLLKNRNIWDVMGSQIDILNPRWNNYLKLLSMDIYKSDKINEDNERISVFEFWRSQLNAIKTGVLVNNNNYIIQMPTSAGKTFIAEIMIVNSLINNPDSKCIYIAPFRALTTQIEENLSNRLGKLGFIVSSASGTYEVDEYQLFLVENADVLVTTPEKIDLLYRLKPEFFENISLIVTDESHIIGNEDERSSLLELLIVKLRKKLENTRFLFISAVMSENDAMEFSKWLSGTSENVISSPKIYGREWEPTRKLIGVYEWYPVQKSGKITFPDEKVEGNKSLFLPNIIKQNVYRCLNPETQRMNTRRFPRNKTARADAVSELAYKFVDDGNVLIFTSRPNWAESIGNVFINSLKYKEMASKNIKSNFKYRNNLESIEMVNKWLGTNHIITKCLKRGIGIHYGPLSEPVRKSIEKDFREKRLEILISTNTIGQGINFPIKTAIIHSLEIDPREDKKVSIRDFWNIVGRAGRAGKETEGQVIFLNLNEKDKELFKEYTDKNNIEPVKSQIFKLVKDLFEDRISEDIFNEKLEVLIEPSLLNILMEESVDTVDENFIKSFIGHSLFKIQLENENYSLDLLNNSIMSIGTKFYSKIEDEKLREIYSKTGFHLSSCIKISDSIKSNIEKLKLIIENDDYKHLLKCIMIVFLDIYEMNDDKFEVSILEGNKEELNLFVNKWIKGASIVELNNFWNTNFSQNGELDGKMQLYINQFLEYRYPWGVTVFLLILIYHLNMNFDNMPKKVEELPENIKNLPAFIKHGLNEPIACMSKTIGVNTREACLELANEYDGDYKFEEFIKWFSNINLFDIDDLNISEYEIKNILYTSNNLNFKKWSSDTFENIECYVQGIVYEKSRVELYNQIEVGAILKLERDFDNLYDIYSIKLMYENIQLGFVSKDIAKKLAIEMDLNGRKFESIIINKPIQQFYSIIVEIYEIEN